MSAGKSQMNLILVGAPGSGKGTQAKRIQERYALPQISTGDILRQAVRDGTKVGLEAKGYMDAGKLVPDAVLVGIIRDRLKADDTNGGFVLDGFPRTLAQAEALDAMLSEATREIFRVILIDVPAEDLVVRITGRRSCKACGSVFHQQFSPPKEEGKCDRCGGELFQREDDTEEKVRVRLEAYEAQTAEVIPYYQKKGLVAQVDGRMAPDAVYGQLEAVLEGGG